MGGTHVTVRITNPVDSEKFWEGLFPVDTGANGAPEVAKITATNYSNLFNPKTSTNFSISEDAPVKITVYNLLGQKVTTMLNDVKEAGKHTIEWNAEDVNSGIYFYKVEIKDASVTKNVFCLNKINIRHGLLAGLSLHCELLENALQM